MKLLTIDTETAGLAPASGTGVCDIAIACVDEDFQVYWKIESLIDPECEISPQAMGVHHITQEMVWDQPTLEEFMRTHRYPLSDVDVIVGHKIDFDIRLRGNARACGDFQRHRHAGHADPVQGPREIGGIAGDIRQCRIRLM